MLGLSRIASRAAAVFRRSAPSSVAPSADAAESSAEIFSAIYSKQLWADPTHDVEAFYSGLGSHDPAIVRQYTEAVSGFLHAFGLPPDVVDLGCGDFNVGRQIRPLCARYVACDVVPRLIEHNRQRFADLDVDFRCLDISEDPLPTGDVVFIRQVLQHLSNARIAKVLAKLSSYRFVVITEHIPLAKFKPNVDMCTGQTIRLLQRPASGVVVTAPPFNCAFSGQRTLCEVFQFGGVIRTIAYEQAFD